MTVICLPKPYLLFLGTTTDPVYAKTALGLKDWAGEHCVGEWVLDEAALATGLPRLDPAAARARGAAAVVIGIAPVGGLIDPAWVAPLVAAMEAGLDIVSGLHMTLESRPELAAAAARLGRRLINVRVPREPLSTGTGRRRRGKRLLTVGTDCALGKKYTALSLANAFKDRGIDTDFRATGQTGIMIAGSGIPIDAVVADFISGAAEALSPDADADHWDVIEGQGSLFHPAFAAVTLGLLHGSQPDVLVLCHEPGRTRIKGYEDFPIPSLPSAIEMYLSQARLTNAAVRCAGISLNTSMLGDAEARAVLDAATGDTGLPAADPVRGLGFEDLVEACLGPVPVRIGRSERA